MVHPVFLSYARATSRPYAEALHGELGDLAFLDTSDIDTGEQFPVAIVDALLGARVVVVFMDALYFERWYCRRELQTALEPFDDLLAHGTLSDKDEERALATIVLALPPGQPAKAIDRLLQHVPSHLRTTQWPIADQTAVLANFVRGRCDARTQTIGAQLGSRSDRVRRDLLEESSLPPPSDLRNIRKLLSSMPKSLRKGFVGRANELWKLHTMLSALEGEAAPAVALFNHGGFGKTRIAAEYVQRLGHLAFPGGLFWINADATEDLLETQFHSILSVLNPDTPDLRKLRESGKNISMEMQKALEALPSAERVLFVVDNVPETPPKALATWCPAIGQVAVLATSRRKLSLQTDGVEEIVVHPLSDQAAVNLLTMGMGVERSRVSPGSWRKIVNWVGGLPLALELLNKALQVGRMSPKKVFAKAQQSASMTTELDAAMEALKDEIPLRGVTEALKMSYEHLSENAKRAARVLAQLASEPIPEALVETLGSDLFTDKVKATLLMRSIVMPVLSMDVSMFGAIHRVLADFLRNETTKAEKSGFLGKVFRILAPFMNNVMKKTENELSLVCRVLAEVMQPNVCRDPLQWPLMIACLPHAEQVFHRSSGLPDQRSPLHALHIVRLGLSIGILYHAQGFLTRARDVKELVVSRSQEWLGLEHPDTLASMSNLAWTLSDQGELAQAAKLGRLVLHVCRPALGAEHPYTLESIHTLAMTLSRQGKLTRAAKLQHLVLDAQRRVLGLEHPDTLASMSNISLTLSRQGELLQAAKLQRQVLDVRRRVLGADHPDTLASMNNLAGTHFRLGELTQTVRLYRQVLYVCRRKLGPWNPSTLTSMHNLGATLSHQGKLTRAAKLLRKALDGRRRVLGVEHVHTSMSAWILMQILIAAKDRDAALSVMRDHLMCLLDRDPAALTADQRKYREWVGKVVTPTGDPKEDLS